jgi:hypothetical protein
VKTGSPDQTDIATTRHQIRRRLQLAQWLGRPLAYCGRHSAICQGFSQYATAGIFCASVNMLTIGQPLRKGPRIANGFDAES